MLSVHAADIADLPELLKQSWLDSDAGHPAAGRRPAAPLPARRKRWGNHRDAVFR